MSKKPAASNRIERLHARMQVSAEIRGFAQSAAVQEWFERYEQAAFQEFLELPAAAHTERYAVQIAIKTIRALQGWMQAVAADGKLAQVQINEMTGAKTNAA